VLVAALDVSPAEALVRLRAYAIGHSLPISEVAHAVLDRRLRPAADGEWQQVARAGGTMTAGREQDVVSALVSLAGSLATGRSDVVELLSELTSDCARLLDVAAAGLLLADDRAVLHVLAASSEQVGHVEALQIQRAQGPCLDCFRDGRPVSVADLRAERARWPQFVPAALAAGFASVHAVPMRLRDTVLGALGLFGAEPGSLNAADLQLAQGMADVASIALVQDRATADLKVVNEQLQVALVSRVVLEQAKGVLSYTAGVDMATAFAMLRHFARDHNLRLSELAASVVHRTLPAQAVVDHSHARGDRPR
jgi:GAF domain-containing protein